MRLPNNHAPIDIELVEDSLRSRILVVGIRDNGTEVGALVHHLGRPRTARSLIGVRRSKRDGSSLAHSSVHIEWPPRRVHWSSRERKIAMRRRMLLLAILAMLGTMFVSPSAAAAPPGGSGSQINILAGTSTTYPAGEAFHIRHGWSFDTAIERPAGHYAFRLEIDGVLQRRGRAIRTHEGTTLTWIWLHDFPAGMTGTHTFTGYWYAPCAETVSAPCAKPHKPTLAFEQSLTVSFTP